MKENKVKINCLLVASVLSLGAAACKHNNSDNKSVDLMKLEAQATMTSDVEIFNVETINDLSGYIKKDIPINKYGSRTDNKFEATGFFRTEQINGRWYFIDPEGYPYIHRGVAVVKPGPKEEQKEVFENRFGSNIEWASQTASELKNLGFYGLGAWSKYNYFMSVTDRIVYTIALAPMEAVKQYHKKQVGGYDEKTTGWKGYEYELVRIFDPNVQRIYDESCKFISKYKDDPYLLGYFIDNELPWVRDALDRHLTKLKPEDPCRIEAQRWLDERKGKPSGVKDITEEDRHDFWIYYAETYYRITSETLRKFDPNHLILGSRCDSYRNELVDADFFKAAGKYMDVISINGYRKWELPQYLMDNWTDWAGKPFMITEFYAKGKDLGFPNEDGVGIIVDTQKERGYYYENYCLNLLKSKGCVGWDWFQYQDYIPARDYSNKGLCDTNYNYYSDLTEVCKNFNSQVYSLTDYFNGLRPELPVRLYPVKDTYVEADKDSKKKYGQGLILKVGEKGKGAFSLLEFNVASLKPYKDQIKNISLNLYLSKSDLNEKDKVSLCVYKSEFNNWTELDKNATVIDNCRTGNDNLLGNAYVESTSLEKYVAIPVTDGIIAGLNDDNDCISLRISLEDSEKQELEFASREARSDRWIPYIDIEFAK